MPEVIREEYLTRLDSLRAQNEAAVLGSARQQLIREYGLEPDRANEVYHYWLGQRNILVESNTSD